MVCKRMSGYSPQTMKAASNQLLKTKIANTPQEEIPLLLLEGAINFIKQAIAIVPADKPVNGDALGFAKQVEGFSNKVMRAHRIVYELNAGLDMERGGEISVNLRRLYLFVGQELGVSLRERDTAKLDRLAGILQDLLDGFTEAVRTERAKAAS